MYTFIFFFLETLPLSFFSFFAVEKEKQWFACVTLGRLIQKHDWILWCSGSNFRRLLYKCVFVSFFYFWFFKSEICLNAQEQTSSTRLKLQVLLLTLSRMERRLTEAHRKLWFLLTMSRSVVSVTHIIVAFLFALILEDNIHIYVHIINENSII